MAPPAGGVSGRYGSFGGHRNPGKLFANPGLPPPQAAASLRDTFPPNPPLMMTRELVAPIFSTQRAGRLTT